MQSNKMLNKELVEGMKLLKDDKNFTDIEELTCNSKETCVNRLEYVVSKMSKDEYGKYRIEDADGVIHKFYEQADLENRLLNWHCPSEYGLMDYADENLGRCKTGDYICFQCWSESV